MIHIFVCYVKRSSLAQPERKHQQGEHIIIRADFPTDDEGTAWSNKLFSSFIFRCCESIWISSSGTLNLLYHSRIIWNGSLTISSYSPSSSVMISSPTCLIYTFTKMGWKSYLIFTSGSCQPWVCTSSIVGMESLTWLAARRIS